VTNVGSTASFPLRGNLDGLVMVQFQGDAAESFQKQGARLRLVTPGFFAAMGVPVVSGRDFTADDRRDTSAVAIVNREFVRRYMTGKDPLRSAFAFGYPTVDTSTFRAIVGVVGDVRYRSIAEDAEPSFYVSQGQFPFPGRPSSSPRARRMPARWRRPYAARSRDWSRSWRPRSTPSRIWWRRRSPGSSSG
jgi:hypothetical protein